MLLKSIKLAGFKSFVDPTTVPIRSRLNAIVGPNGCGKSNVVDAIRWVIGEMSAKQLRGQSMSDVIFNGTKNRSAVGRASIELLFDNRSGRLGGPYAAYSEFAIRREIAREGISNYFINGTPCRRRDIVDVFLGTGLGSQNYAIIEQGMIARLIEAKPDELRVYLEEAAGISKYKDRRRETETRMRQTQDNLSRLNDVLDELTKQQRHLKRQANAAERYKSLKEEGRYLTAQIKALQWQVLDAQLQETNEQLRMQTTSSEKSNALQRELEAKLEKEHLAHADAQQVLNDIQQQYYQLNTDIARFETQIHHLTQQKSQWSDELKQTQTLKDSLIPQMQLQQEKLQTLKAQLTNAEPSILENKQSAEKAKQLLDLKEAEMKQFQAAQETAALKLQEVLRKTDITQTQLTHYQTRMEAIKKRLNDLNSYDAHETLKTLQETEKPLEEDINALKIKIENVNQELSSAILMLQSAKSKRADLIKQKQAHEKTLYDNKRNLAVLEGLQSAAFGHNNEVLKSWLEKHKLLQYQRLAQCLQVDSAWERAAQIVLQDFFDALCVQSIEPYHELLHGFPQGRLTLIEKTSSTNDLATLPYETLADKVQSNGLIDGVLKNIYLADLAQAYQIRSKLTHGQSVITKGGVWLGENWIRIFKTSAQQESVLSREKKIKVLANQILDIEKTIEKLTVDIEETDASITQAETQRDALNNTQRALQAQSTSLETKLNEQKFRLSTLEKQQAQWMSEKQSSQTELETLDTKSREAQETLAELAIQQTQCLAQKDEKMHEKTTLENELCKLRENAVSANRVYDALLVRFEGQKNESSILTQTIEQTEKQLSHLANKSQELEKNLSSNHSPMTDISTNLQNALKKRLTIEAELTKARSQFDAEETAISQLKSQLQKSLSSVNDSQSAIQELRMTVQRITLEASHLNDAILNVNHTLEAIRNALPADITQETVTLQLEQNQKRIERLGPINLAAIHEHEEVSKRLEYLEKQKEDLLSALNTLKEAISKVDKETRARFKKTFDVVNENFASLFPRIFNGGHAELQLTEDDLLNAGVIVKAQPPGKRNTSIHLLSGGEKTLTAIGLVFALFELNPAPFCILDEVDAPLDDINVGRFCQLLKEMTDKTQFLIITHNKVTMEMADVLMGVTMQEAGVSRLVSVTMEDAIKYAKSSEENAIDA